MEKPKKIRSFTLDDDAYEALDKQAKRNQRSASGELNVILHGLSSGDKK